jgi:hypothetical protein
LAKATLRVTQDASVSLPPFTVGVAARASLRRMTVRVRFADGRVIATRVRVSG